MSVVVEALEEALAHVLVDEGVVRDLVTPRRELVCSRELTVDEEVCHFQVVRLLGELLDRVAAVPQDSGLAVQVGNGALAGSG